MTTPTTIWGLIVEEHGSGWNSRYWRPEVLDHLTGTREQAMHALRLRAQNHRPGQPAMARRRLLYQDTDGFLLVVQGATQTFHSRFTLATLLHDTAWK